MRISDWSADVCSSDLKGAEYGTVTKRPRRCGWFDAVAARRSIFNNSVTGLCVTKLDVLDDLDVIRICTGYKVNGQPVELPPIGAEGFAKVEVLYEEFPGWQTNAERKSVVSGKGVPVSVDHGGRLTITKKKI